MSVKQTVISQIRQVAQEQNKSLAPLTDDLVLLELGLICSALLSWWRSLKMCWDWILSVRPLTRLFR